MPGFQGISSPGTLAPGLAPALFSHLRSTHLGYTGLCWGLGHLKIETRLRGERIDSESVMCEYDLDVIVTPSIFKFTRNTTYLTRM